jgi:hypothetical protein
VVMSWSPLKASCPAPGRGVGLQFYAFTAFVNALMPDETGSAHVITLLIFLREALRSFGAAILVPTVQPEREAGWRT